METYEPVGVPSVVDNQVSSEKNRKKNKQIAWLVIGGVLILSMFTSSLESKNTSGIIPKEGSFSEKTLQGSGPDKIAVIKVEGVITDSSSSSSSLLGGSEATADSIISQIKEAKDDPNVKAIILSVNSPGGSVTASQMIQEKVLEFKNSGKKVVSLMRETAASGGYYISAPANKIVANRSTLTGSIGVIMEFQNYKDLYSKIGVKPTVFKAGKFKDIGSSARDVTPEEAKVFQDLVNEDYEGFLDVVSSGRKIDKEKLRPIADGRIYSGKQAKEAGLVDELGNIDKAISVAKKEAGLKDATVVEYTEDWVSSFLGSAPGGFGLNGLLNKFVPKNSSNYSGTSFLWVP